MRKLLSYAIIYIVLCICYFYDLLLYISLHIYYFPTHKYTSNVCQDLEREKKINHAIQVEFSANDNNFKSKQAFNITTSCNTLKPPKKFNFEYENEANSFDDHEMEKNCNPLLDISTMDMCLT